ncbi:ABC transporter permease [Paenibacillus cisolokensis]|jgi:ABC-type nitrate/sulfonate/bicarbonate transport system, permease component|uniref:ABC transporter permease n=1 Tax=Paenibacillus cisolokensis TaxID=1658519 RepID=A0ABQ4NA60_9BACL|nr:ABC transporter permease [Paenibacillus cisolokensis]GIQ65076.1 ABC transporter permease [Paenibacillus cisolokensis]
MSERGILWRIVAGQILLLVLFLGTVEVVVQKGIVGRLYLSAPTQVVQELVKLLQQSETFRNLYVTLLEFTLGFGLSVVLGFGIGLFLVLVSRAEQFFNPFLSALMAIPKVTIVPLLTLWLGIGLVHKVAVVFLFCIFPIIYNTVAGIKQTSENYLKVARVFEATSYQTVTKVILPSAVPSIFAGLRVSAGSGLIGALFGEMLASKEGLGNMLVQSTSLYDTARVFALITVVTVVSILIIAFINLLEKKVFLRWKSS